MRDLEALQASIERARSTKEIERLLLGWEGNPAEAMGIVARHAPLWSPMLFLLAWQAHGSASLLFNSHRTPELNRLLAEWEVKRLREKDGKRSSRAISALIALAEEGSLHVGNPLMREVEAVVFEPPKRQALTEAQAGALWVLLHHPQLPPQEMLRLTRELEGRLSWYELLLVAAHPNLPEAQRPGFLDASLEAAGAAKGNILQNLGQRDPLRRHPECRRRLVALALDAGLGHEPLLRDGWDDDFGVLLADVFRRNLLRAQSFLRVHGDEVARRISPEALQPLLSAPHAEVRLAGIGLLGQVLAAQEVSGPRPVGMETSGPRRVGP
jgi:hypothetical protein